MLVPFCVLLGLFSLEMWNFCGSLGVRSGENGSWNGSLKSGRFVGTHVCFYYIKKACPCEQALEFVCGKVALGRVLRYNKKVGLRIVVFLFRTR